METISTYTREDAIEDGVLIDVTKKAKEAGFKIPVAITETVQSKCVDVTENLKARGQDESGRLWDVLYMAYRAAQNVKPGIQTVRYKLSVLCENEQGGVERTDEELTMKIHPDQHGNAVITIGYPLDF